MTAQEILTEANLQDTYWGKIIIQAEAGSGFSNTQRHEAGDWCTCACGRVTCDIPRRASGDKDAWPLDEDLYSLGMDFYDAVCSNALKSPPKFL